VAALHEISYFLQELRVLLVELIAAFRRWVLMLRELRCSQESIIEVDRFAGLD